MNIYNFKNYYDYLGILNGCLLADIIILLIVYYTPYFDSKYLKLWYEKYRLSAVIADVLILVIGIIITRYIFSIYNLEYNIINFIFITLAVQIIHDIIFFIFFSNIPKGTNKMLDLFKDYAKEVGYNAILGDSLMIVIAILCSVYFLNKSINFNLISLIIMTYMIPYIIYTK